MSNRQMHSWVEQTVQDLRYAVRGLRLNPGFTLTAALAAAIAIGASTAVFSAVDRILFRPLPYGDEERLVSAGIMAPLDTNEFMLADAYFDLRRNPGPFVAVTSFQAGEIACDLTELSRLRSNNPAPVSKTSEIAICATEATAAGPARRAARVDPAATLRAE